MKTLSLKLRIGLCITAMTLLIIIVLSAVAYCEFKEALVTSLDNRLRSDTRSVIDFMATDETPDEKLRVINLILSSDTDSHRLGYGIWFDDENEYLARSDSFEKINKLLQTHSKDVFQKGEHTFYTIDYEGSPCRVIWARYPNTLQGFSDKSMINIVVALSGKNAWHEIGEFLRLLLILGGITLWVTVGLVMWVLRWGLKPVNYIAGQMDDISSGNMMQLEIDIPGSPEELQPFVIAWGKMLKRLSNSMRQQKQFTADASHELRTPLAIIKSTLQIARFKKRSAESYESAIDQCLEDTMRLEKLTGQLLELARFDEESAHLQYKDVDLQELIANACEQYLETANQKKQTLIVNTCKLNFRCNGDHILRAISNLIENAIKYGPKETDILIGLKQSDNAIILTIHDEGGNISSKELDSVFDRFYRTDTARNHKSGGAGLGLAITKEIIQRHDGKISVKSSPESGTDFVITLPMSLQ